MRASSILGLAALLALVAVGGSNATANLNEPTTQQEPMGICYEWKGQFGVLNLVNTAGHQVMAMTADGQIVADLCSAQPYEQVLAFNSGQGQDGVVLRVRVEGVGEFAVVDPDWIWE